MKLQAEATCQLSNAVDRMARNEERQTKLMELIFKLLSKVKLHNFIIFL